MSRYSRGAPSSTLYVRNISERVRYDDLRRLFMKYGKLVDVTIPLDYYSGMPKGYCFVEFEDPRDAEEAQYRMDRQRLFGREIEVEFARGDRKTPGEMRNRDRDRYYPRGAYGGRGGGGSSGGSRGMDDYYRDRRSRSRSRGGDDRRRGRESGRDVARSKSREASFRSKSRSRSYSKNRTPSPRANNHKSVSRSRSPRDRSNSRQRGSPRRGEGKSPRQMNSRTPSPA